MSTRLTALVMFWLGAAVLFIAVVAPAAFAVLPSRTMAGLVIGRVLPVLFWSGATVGAVVLVMTSGWPRAAALIMILACLGAQLGVAPAIRTTRAALGADLEAVDPSDPRRVTFGRLHAISVALLGVGMLAAASVALGGVLSHRTLQGLGALGPVRRTTSADTLHSSSTS